MRIRLKHVLRDVDRYGVVRFYFRRRKGEKKIRLPDDDSSEDFLFRYHEVRSGSSPVNAAPHALAGRAALSAGTFHWLVVEYLQTTPYLQLAKTTQGIRRGVLQHMLREPIRPGAVELYTEMPLAEITHKALKVLRDRQTAMPNMANERVKALRHLFKWATEQEYVDVNPSKDLLGLACRTEGHHTWTVEEVAQFEARHPTGTKARLALALLLWTGVRRSDVVLLGKQHVRGGWLAFTAKKNRARIEMPVLPCLQQAIDASPTGDLTFFVGSRGHPLTAHTFGNWFRDRCKEAGVPGRAHGLRKAGAVTAAENGATTQQLMSIFGWKTVSEAERYTRAADRKKMAGDAMPLMVRQVCE